MYSEKKGGVAVEDMMVNHPKIRDLVIVGISDELKEETATLNEIQAYGKPIMAPYKVPVAVEFINEIF